MARVLDGPIDRRIRVRTRFGVIEGSIAITGGVSTLHYLNVVAMSQNFLRLKPPLDCPREWVLEDAPLAVATESILFVTEVAEFVPRPMDPHAAARFKRAPVRLRVAEHVVEGFLHVPPGGDPIARLNQDRHAFIALTSATVSGSDQKMSAPFLALSRADISAFQQVEADSLVEEMAIADHDAR